MPFCSEHLLDLDILPLDFSCSATFTMLPTWLLAICPILDMLSNTLSVSFGATLFCLDRVLGFMRQQGLHSAILEKSTKQNGKLLGFLPSETFLRFCFFFFFLYFILLRFINFYPLHRLFQNWLHRRWSKLLISWKHYGYYQCCFALGQQLSSENQHFTIGREHLICR